MSETYSRVFRDRARIDRSMNRETVSFRRHANSFNRVRRSAVSWTMIAIFFRKIRSLLYAGQNGGARAHCCSDKQHLCTTVTSRLSVAKINVATRRWRGGTAWESGRYQPVCCASLCCSLPPGFTWTSVILSTISRRWALEYLTLLGEEFDSFYLVFFSSHFVKHVARARVAPTT